MLHRCPACREPPGEATCACGERFPLFPLLSCPACGDDYNHARCERCEHVAPFAEWLDPTQATPELERAAKEGDVVLPADLEPRYPERCVVCLRARTSGTLEVTALASSWARRWIYGWILAPLISRRVTRTLPACPPCEVRYQRARTARWLMTWGLALSIYVVLRVGTPLGRGTARWIALGAWVLGYLASALLIRSYVELEVDDSKGQATWTFENEPYALEFARLNRSTPS